MRKLNTSDVFAAARCLRVIGARETILKFAQAADTVDDVWNGGFMLFWQLLEDASEARSEAAVYEMLARPLEMEPDAVANLPLEELLPLLKQLAADNDLRRFFKLAQDMTK